MSRLIKKYKNRRLYDTELSQYITIENLQHYVVDGIVFKVEDASSGEDITNTILLQILVEMEGRTTQFLSSEVLRQIIRLAQHPMNQSLKGAFEDMMALMNQQLQSSPYLGDYQKFHDAWNKQMQDFYKKWHDIFKS